MSSNFFRKLLRSAKSSAKPFSMHFLGGSSYEIIIVYAVCRGSKVCHAVHDCFYIYLPILTVLPNFETSAPILPPPQSCLYSWNSLLMMPTILLISPNDQRNEWLIKNRGSASRATTYGCTGCALPKPKSTIHIGWRGVEPQRVV